MIQVVKNAEGKQSVKLAKMVAMSERLTSLKGNLKVVQPQIVALEATKPVSLDDPNARLDGTPGLGLKGRFKCDCGASGFVAIHIKCTKCGKETWSGWWPKGD